MEQVQIRHTGLGTAVLVPVDAVEAWCTPESGWAIDPSPPATTPEVTT